MDLSLPTRIRTPKDIAKFFAYLLEVDKTEFHPDDNFSNYGHMKNGVWIKAYTKQQAALRNKLMTQAADVANAYDLNIYCIGMWAKVAYYGEDPAAGPEDCDKEKLLFYAPVKGVLDWRPPKRRTQ